MKKFLQTCSPFVLLILPALLFVSLSFAINKEVKYTTIAKKSYSLNNTNSKVLIDYGKNSLIRLLLK